MRASSLLQPKKEKKKTGAGAAFGTPWGMGGGLREDGDLLAASSGTERLHVAEKLGKPWAWFMICIWGVSVSALCL